MTYLQTLSPKDRQGRYLNPLWWVRGREPHLGYGGTHFHALIGGLTTDVRRDEAYGWWFERYGINRIEPYDPERGAAHYLTKYVVKQLGDVRFSDNLGLLKRGKLWQQ